MSYLPKCDLCKATIPDGTGMGLTLLLNVEGDEEIIEFDLDFRCAMSLGMKRMKDGWHWPRDSALRMLKLAVKAKEGK